MKKLYVAHRLFAQPSFVAGVASVLDLGATLQEYNTSATDHEADVDALKNDWRAVGDDLKEAITLHERRSAKQPKR